MSKHPTATPSPPWPWPTLIFPEAHKTCIFLPFMATESPPPRHHHHHQPPIHVRMMLMRVCTSEWWVLQPPGWTPRRFFLSRRPLPKRSHQPVTVSPLCSHRKKRAFFSLGILDPWAGWMLLFYCRNKKSSGFVASGWCVPLHDCTSGVQARLKGARPRPGCITAISHWW